MKRDSCDPRVEANGTKTNFSIWTPGFSRMQLSHPQPLNEMTVLVVPRPGETSCPLEDPQSVGKCNE
ncbi:rCG46465 [Rattus norvegicus]|uniref:RCG46465 n=1 Tax=Rattus norvegicus TaxID=10116 RepID=A6IDF6_RAT|nr:rCG46465 [Rattus norvegicus]